VSAPVSPGKLLVFSYSESEVYDGGDDEASALAHFRGAANSLEQIDAVIAEMGEDAATRYEIIDMESLAAFRKTSAWDRENRVSIWGPWKEMEMTDREFGGVRP